MKRKLARRELRRCPACEAQRDPGEFFEGEEDTMLCRVCRVSDLVDLSASDKAVIAALSAGRSVRGAAAAGGIPERDLKRRLELDEDFRQVFRQILELGGVTRALIGKVMHDGMTKAMDIRWDQEAKEFVHFPAVTARARTAMDAARLLDLVPRNMKESPVVSIKITTNLGGAPPEADDGSIIARGTPIDITAEATVERMGPAREVDTPQDEVR